MRGIITEITKSEFLQACNEKVRLDGLQDAEAERLRREEEERRRREEEERRRREEAERLRREQEEAERLRREQEQRENAQWDAWYRNVPSACKRGFTVGEFSYSIDANQRKIYKTSNLGGNAIGLAFSSGGINQELGI